MHPPTRLFDIPDWRNDPDVIEGFRRFLRRRPGGLRLPLEDGDVSLRDVILLMEEVVRLDSRARLEGGMPLVDDVEIALEYANLEHWHECGEDRLLRDPKAILALYEAAKTDDIRVSLRELLHAADAWELRRLAVREFPVGETISAEVLARTLALPLEDVLDLARSRRLPGWPDEEDRWHFPAWVLNANGTLDTGVVEICEWLESPNLYRLLEDLNLAGADGIATLDLARGGRVRDAINLRKLPKA